MVDVPAEVIEEVTVALDAEADRWADAVADELSGDDADEPGE